jgi:hypothetical protein
MKVVGGDGFERDSIRSRNGIGKDTMHIASGYALNVVLSFRPSYRFGSVKKTSVE